MSFLRPEARAALARWAESAVAGTILAVSGWEALALLSGADLRAVLAAVAAALSAAWLRTAIMRALMKGAGAAPGIAALREGEIGYFGPETGGVMALDAIRRVEIVRRGPLRVWRLTDGEGRALEIPTDAKGAEAVAEGLEALPGFSDGAALAALGRRGAGVALVWQRPSDGPRISRA